MAKTAECVWFRNKLTGAVDGVDRGSAAHRRLATESIDDEDGVPYMVWEELTGDAIPQVKSAKYVPGMQATVYEAGTPVNRPEAPPEGDGQARVPKGPRGPNAGKSPEAAPATPAGPVQ